MITPHKTCGHVAAPAGSRRERVMIAMRTISMVALTILGTSVACADATSPQERDDEGSQDAGSAAYPTGDADAGSSSSASSTEVADSASFHTERSSDGATSASTSALPAVASSSSDSTELSPIHVHPAVARLRKLVRSQRSRRLHHSALETSRVIALLHRCSKAKACWRCT